MLKKGVTNDDFFKGLEEALPPIFTRKTASRMTGGMFTARTLSNLDAAGKGPASKVRVGKNVIYERQDFIDWLHSSIRPMRGIARPVQKSPLSQGPQRNTFWDSLPS